MLCMLVATPSIAGVLRKQVKSRCGLPACFDFRRAGGNGFVSAPPLISTVGEARIVLRQAVSRIPQDRKHYFVSRKQGISTIAPRGIEIDTVTEVEIKDFLFTLPTAKLELGPLTFSELHVRLNDSGELIAQCRIRNTGKESGRTLDRSLVRVHIRAHGKKSPAELAITGPVLWQACNSLWVDRNQQAEFTQLHSAAADARLRWLFPEVSRIEVEFQYREFKFVQILGGS